MGLIRPSEVTAKILSLIEDSKKELIIVSPYNEFGKWDKLKRYLSEAKEKGIKISYYARAGENHDCVAAIGIAPILIKNLHAKMYLNESYAILSSMNLVEASDKKSIDFAILTENESGYKEVRNYFNEYILPKADENRQTPQQLECPFQEYFTSNPGYNPKLHSLCLDYHKNSSYIKEVGFKKNGDKWGNWFRFNSDGLLERVERYFEGHTKEQVVYNNKVSRYYLLFTAANVAGGLYGCSIKDFYFKSYLKDFIRDDPKKYFEHLKDIFELDFLDYNAKYVEDLVDEIHDGLYNKSKLFNF